MIIITRISEKIKTSILHYIPIYCAFHAKSTEKIFSDFLIQVKFSLCCVYRKKPFFAQIFRSNRSLVMNIFEYSWKFEILFIQKWITLSKINQYHFFFFSKCSVSQAFSGLFKYFVEFQGVCSLFRWGDNFER